MCNQALGRARLSNVMRTLESSPSWIIVKSSL
jgi:hypothetical protein